MKSMPGFVAAIIAASAQAGPTSFDLSTANGEQLYQRYCASCHGVSGQGDGIVAAALSVTVPDLTLLARRNRGRYPAARVSEVIDGRVLLDAHGSRTMPVWGQEFWMEAGADSQAEYATRVMVERLVNYLRSLQRADAADGT